MNTEIHHRIILVQKRRPVKNTDAEQVANERIGLNRAFQAGKVCQKQENGKSHGGNDKQELRRPVLFYRPEIQNDKKSQ
jgi:hypothetical protein